jgi:RES domain-containing protein
MHPDPDDSGSELDAALEASFPASDPPAVTSPIAMTAAVAQVPLAEAPNGSHPPLRLYRIIEARQASEPFSGPGSDGGGRWTSPGTMGVYASLSPSTAMLEYLVHLEGATPENLLLVAASVPHDCVLVQLQLPGDWRERPYRPSVRQVGDAWSESQRSLALRLPSVVCPDECNLIVNPGHRDFVKLQVEMLTPITLDARLRV